MSEEDIKAINADLGDAVVVPGESEYFTDKIQIHVCGRKYKTLFTKKFIERKKWEAPDPTEVKSIIPGSVSEISVKEGDAVKKGDQLMIYEAMKMKNVIVAPYDATVEKICVETGNKLHKGAVLIKLKPSAE